MKTAIRVISVPTSVAESVRTTLRAPRYGHPAHTEIASGYGPCRHCLRYFSVGNERRILFTYDPFEGLEALPLPGPVFVHAEPCVRYDESAGFPAELTEHALTLVGYGCGRTLIAEEHLSADADAEKVARDLLARSDVGYVHVRDTQAGCYDFRVERAR